MSSQEPKFNELKTAILEAIQSNNEVLLQQMVKQSDALNFIALLNGKPYSPLSLAVSLKSPTMIQCLIKLGAKILSKHPGTFSLLEMARELQLDKSMIQMLEEASLEQMKKEDKAKNWLDFTNLKEGNPRLVWAFLGDIENLSKSSLDFVSAETNTDKDISSFNVFTSAIAGGNFKTVQFILDKVKEQGGFKYSPTVCPKRTPVVWLWKVAISGNDTLFDFILNWVKQYPDKLSESIKEVFRLTIKHNEVEAALLILKHYPMVIYEIWWDIKETCLMIATYSNNEPTFDAILECEKTLKQSGQAQDKAPLIDVCTTEGLNVLLYAAKQKHSRFSQKILALRPQMLYSTLKNGCTTLIQAARIGALENVNLFLSMDSNAKQTLIRMNSCTNYTPFMFAAYVAHWKVLERMLSNIEDPSILLQCNEEGRNIVHLIINGREYLCTLKVKGKTILPEQEADCGRMIKLVLDKYDPSSKLLHSKTPRGSNILQMAASSTTLEIFDEILSRDKQLLFQRGADGMTTLMYCLTIFEYKYAAFNQERVKIADRILEIAPEMVLLKDDKNRNVFELLQESYEMISKIKVNSGPYHTYNLEDKAKREEDEYNRRIKTQGMETVQALRARICSLFVEFRSKPLLLGSNGIKFHEFIENQNQQIILDKELKSQESNYAEQQLAIAAQQRFVDNLDHANSEMKSQIDALMKKNSQLEEELSLELGDKLDGKELEPKPGQVSRKRKINAGSQEAMIFSGDLGSSRSETRALAQALQADSRSQQADPGEDPLSDLESMRKRRRVERR